MIFSKAGHRLIESRLVQQEPTKIRTVYGQAKCTKLINQLEYNQPAGIYLRLSLVAACDTLSFTGGDGFQSPPSTPPMGEYNVSAGGIPLLALSVLMGNQAHFFPATCGCR